MSFVLGMVVGAAVVMLLPPEQVGRFRQQIISMWQKFTKKG
jgi:hypothetical protein